MAKARRPTRNNNLTQVLPSVGWDERRVAAPREHLPTPPTAIFQIKKMKTFSTIALSCATTLVSLAASAQSDDTWNIAKLDTSKLPPASSQTNVTFAKDIQPILQSSCTRCHGQEHQRGGLRLDSLASALEGGDDGKMIVPGDSKSSLLVAAIAQLNNDVAMPPKRRAGNHHGPPAGPPPDQGPGPGGPPPGANQHGPTQNPLTAAQIALVRAWIDQGAK